MAEHTLQEIVERLDRIEAALAAQAERPLTHAEAAKFLGLSRSTLYKMTSAGKISCSRPGGKVLYFTMKDLIQWSKENRSASDREIARGVAQSGRRNPSSHL